MLILIKELSCGANKPSKPEGGWHGKRWERRKKESIVNQSQEQEVERKHGDTGKGGHDRAGTAGGGCDGVSRIHGRKDAF